MKKHNGWKVLLRNRESVSNWNKKNPISLIYPVGVEVFPKKGSKIFFFKREVDARLFSSRFNVVDHLVVKCVVKKPKKIKLTSSSCEDIINFWKNKKYLSLKSLENFDTRVAPQGTYVCDSLTCLE